MDAKTPYCYRFCMRDSHFARAFPCPPKVLPASSPESAMKNFASAIRYRNKNNVSYVRCGLRYEYQRHKKSCNSHDCDIDIRGCPHDPWRISEYITSFLEQLQQPVIFWNRAALSALRYALTFLIMLMNKGDTARTKATFRIPYIINRAFMQATPPKRIILL